jgi:trimethylamine--corrinoid protein Co-methyltransferase
LTLSQLIKESTPIILGILPAFFDMKTMVSFFDPNSILLNLACGEMMAFYNLPHCGISGSGAGWGPDILAGETLCMSHLTGCSSKVGLAPFVGGNFDSLAFSPAAAVYAHEIISQSLRFARGFKLDDVSTALKEIDKAGPGGNFLTSEQTISLFRDAYYTSPIFPRLTLEKWQAQGGPKAGELLRKYTRELLDGLTAPEDHADLIARGEAFIKRFVSGQA